LLFGVQCSVFDIGLPLDCEIGRFLAKSERFPK